MSLLPTPSSDVSFYPFADGGVLFLKGSRRLVALNAASAWIWCLLGEVASLDELADRLAAAFSIDPGRALQDADAVLNRFEQEGLFVHRASCSGNVENDDPWDITPSGPKLVAPEHWKTRGRFRVADHRFEFCCQDAGLGRALMRLMEHLAVDGRDGPADTRLAVAAATEGTQRWDIFLDEWGFAGGLPANEVLPHLATLVFVRSCEALTHRLLFHAGVVERNGIALILPGEAGSGKTTLVATLLMHGWRFFSDELAVIDVEKGTVAPLPLPMSIKPGSVKVLERYYPGLAALPVHLRTDGKLVRYLSPSLNSFPAAVDGTAAVNALIFPKYMDESRNRLESIAKIEALQRLAATGSSNRAFTDWDLACMIGLVESRPCYELVYQDLDQAVALIERQF
jgi:HprK-related kinase A